MINSNILILGFGYTGSFLKPYLLDHNNYINIHSTSRSNNQHLIFDLENPATWDNIPESNLTFWTFPAAPLDLVKSFYKEKKGRLGQLVVLGSTSAFVTSRENEVVNESSTLDLEVQRVRGENYLRKQGANLIYSAGIYGPQRNPIEWVKKSYVGRTDKLVNMIHVEDLCQILFKASQVNQRGNIYIASDNNPKSWNEAIDVWESQKLINNTPAKDSNRISKKIDSSKTLKELNIQLKHPSFIASIF